MIPASQTQSFDRRVLSWTADLVKSHPAVILTLLYLQVYAIGMIYNYFLLRFFRINVFDYALISDFLLAAFKQPPILITSVVMLPFGISYYYFLIWLFPKIISARFLLSERMKLLFFWFNMIIAIVYTFLPAYFFAKDYALQIKEGKGPKVFLSSHSPNTIDFLETTNPVSIIASTERFFFFFDDSSKNAFVIPTSDLHYMEYKSFQSPSIDSTGGLNNQ